MNRDSIRKNIIIGPSSKNKGGVSHFYQVANKYFSEKTEYWSYEIILPNSILSEILSLIKTFFVLLRIMFNRKHTIVLNPSLMQMSVLRNSLFALGYKLVGGNNLVVFWRGWKLGNEKYLSNQVVRYSLLEGNRHFVLNSIVINYLNLDAKIPKKQITLLSTMVDDDLIDVEDLEIKRYNSINPTLIFMGRIEPYKGIYQSIELLNYNEVIKLKIYGDGSILNELLDKKIPEYNGRLKYGGFVSGSEKKLAYLDADIFILLSDSEGMPNGLLEAMALGLPIICTAVGAMCDFFMDDKMGLLVKHPIDLKHLNMRLNTLLSNPLKIQEIGEFNKTYIAENFLASKVIKKFEEHLMLRN